MMKNMNIGAMQRAKYTLLLVEILEMRITSCKHDREIQRLLVQDTDSRANFN